MSETPTTKYIFERVALQNENIAKSFKQFRQQLNNTQSPPCPTQDSPTATVLYSRQISSDLDSTQAYTPAPERNKKTLLILGVVTLIIGALATCYATTPNFGETLLSSIKITLLTISGFCIGLGSILIFENINKNPLKDISPPNTKTNDPLVELKHLAERTVSRLKTAYQVQITTAIPGGP